MLLGLDLGTTNVKALLVGPDGTVAAQGACPVSLRHTPDGGVEQDIEEIWAATLAAIRAAGRESDLSVVRAVGVSSQGGAIQLRTRDGRCDGPVISWLDSRGRPFDEAFGERVGEPWLTARIGHGRSGVAVGQILRLRKAAPHRLDPPAVVGFVGDTIVQRLCGRAAHDGSSLSICCLYNPARRGADPDVLREVGLAADQLPDLLPARQAAGVLLPDVARDTGLPAGVPVSPAVHDQYAAALGCGAIDAGDVMFGCGTAWVLVAIADRLLPPVTPSAWVCDHVVPDRWGQLLSLVVGGSAFQWARDLAGLADATPDAIDSLLDSVPPGSEGLRLRPFLDGWGGHRRPIGGALLNLRLAHGRAHLLRATLEGLCFELNRQLGWLDAAGCPAKRLIMCGGAARSRCTPQIVADVTRRTVVCPRQSEISAFGAAVLARALAEPGVSLEPLCREMVGPVRAIVPGAAAEAYAPIAREYIRELP